jgi:hypothetical protein
MLVLIVTGGGGTRSSGAEPAQLHPAVILGMRVNTIKQGWAVAPVLVVTRSEEAFFDALEMWSPQARFPILFDDGSSQAREQIARFHRAFKPEKTLVFGGDETASGGFSVARVDKLIARIWGDGQAPEGARVWGDTQYKPPGVLVLAHKELALASAVLSVGHGEPIVSISLPRGGRGGLLTQKKASDLAATIARELDAIGYEWDAIGDDIEALTILANSQTRYRDGAKNILALSDFLGRDPSSHERFAWVSFMQGTTSYSVYQAMSSLFLHPRSSWLFNSYGSDAGNGLYEVAPAAELFEKVEFESVAFDSPNNRMRQWYEQTRGALDASLVFVNTAGNAPWFQLGDERMSASSLPLLDTPAAVYFIHSFSAMRPGDARTILGQWERRGSFVYYGSCDEPFLGAFRPPAEVVARLLAGMPWAAAPRRDGTQIWKLNTFGDPLWTLSHVPESAPIPARFESEEFGEVGSLYRGLLQERQFVGAAAYMRWLNKDEDIIRLAGALLGSEAGLPAELGEIALHVAAHRGEADIAPALFRACEAQAEEDPFLEDLLWYVMRPAFGAMRDPATLALLQGHMRVDSYARDASDLLPIIRRIHGDVAADRAADRFIDEAPNKQQRLQLKKLGVR